MMIAFLKKAVKIMISKTAASHQIISRFLNMITARLISVLIHLEVLDNRTIFKVKQMLWIQKLKLIKLYRLK